VARPEILPINVISTTSPMKNAITSKKQFIVILKL